MAAKMMARRDVAAEKDHAYHADSVERLKAAPGFVPEEISGKAPSGAVPGESGPVSAIFGPRAAEPPARSAGTQEARIEGLRDALEGVRGEVIVLRPRDIAESGRKLRRRRFSR